MKIMSGCNHRLPGNLLCPYMALYELQWRDRLQLVTLEVCAMHLVAAIDAAIDDDSFGVKVALVDTKERS